MKRDSSRRDFRPFEAQIGGSPVWAFPFGRNRVYVTIPAFMDHPFLEALKKKILIFDGAMGTNLQLQNLTPQDFDGKDGCNEYLVVTKPDAVRKIHQSFLEVGCDAIETDTFGS